MHCLGNSILFRAKTAFQNKAAKEIAPSGEPLSKKAIASTGETRVKNPTQKASKRVINSTPQGARKERLYQGKHKAKQRLSSAIVRTPNGWGGIRTPGSLTTTPVFKTGALNRSATHPTNVFTGFS